MMFPNSLANRLQDPVAQRTFNPPAAPVQQAPVAQAPIARPVQPVMQQPNLGGMPPASNPIQMPTGAPIQGGMPLPSMPLQGGQPPIENFNPQQPGMQPQNYNALAQRLQQYRGMI